MLDRTPWLPVNVEIEQGLLGCLLMNREAFNIVSDRLRPEYFHEELHQQLFDVIATLARAGKPTTPLTVKTFLPAGAKVGELTVPEYLARLASEACVPIVVGDFAETVRDLYDRRSLQEIGRALIDSQGAASASEAAGWGVEALDAIVAERGNTGTPSMSMGQLMACGVDASAVAYQNDGALIGLPYGIADLDRLTLGAQRGELIVIGGRPGSGKSSLVLGVARNMGHAGLRGLFWSYEMGGVSLAHRMQADELFYPGTRLTYHKIRSGRFDTHEFDQIVEAARRLATMPLRIEQKSGAPFAQIAARARQMKRREGLDFIVADHLGLIRPSERYRGNKANELGEITAGAKELAKELDVPFFMVVQLNRGVEGRDDKRPTMADIRASGEIEQDADTIILLYREAYYLGRKEPSPGTAEHLTWQNDIERCWNRLDAIVEKQRNGPTGVVKLFVDIGCNAIRDLQDTTRLPGDDNLEQIAQEKML